jgi:hypothetical protein
MHWRILHGRQSGSRAEPERPILQEAEDQEARFDVEQLSQLSVPAAATKRRWPHGRFLLRCIEIVSASQQS